MELPISLLEEYCICRGKILHSDIFESIDHPKFFVVIGVSESSIVGFFYINSDINRFINNKPEQLLMQYPLYADDYSFLSHNSFICATNIIELPIARLSASLKNGRTKIIGDLKEGHLNELLDKLRKSKLFSKIQKERYFK